MTKRRPSVRKREREIEKRQREVRKARKAADKRERRLKRGRELPSVASEDRDVTVGRDKIAPPDTADTEEPSIAEERMSR